ncbi:hypothetical protein ACFE04_009625 [Oxalis oulophora]
MGNTCVGPSIAKNGIFQSVSAVVWRSRSPEGSVVNGNGENASEMATKEPESPFPVQDKPPEQITMPKAEPIAEAKPEIKPEKPSDKAKKHIYMKRVPSAGLKADVLQRKTENLKEFFSLGKKLGAYEDPMAVHVVMELCAGGELFDRIIQRGHYTERKAAELTRTIVGVVEACHSLGVMHRDLKPENFLFVDEQEDSLLKTIDFGLSVFFKPGETFIDVVGSPYYVAPEVLRKRYGPEADVWSAGVILYILLSGVPPFWAESEEGIFEQVLHGDLDFSSDPWPNISESAKDLVRKMLIRDPKRRLTAHEVLCHPWVQEDGVAPDKPLDSAVLSRMKQFSAMNKLKKLALRVIAESLSEEEIAGLKQMFKMIDTDNSGQITFDELKVGLKRVGANLKESEIYDLMQAADVDNSGTIDYGEFVAATLHLNKIEREDHLFAAFSYFDKDGSGYITPDELQQACEEFGIEDIRLEEMIQEVDQDNVSDFSLSQIPLLNLLKIDEDGRIDYNEFVAMMQKGTIVSGAGESATDGPCPSCRYDMPIKGPCVDSACRAACRVKYTGKSGYGHCVGDHQCESATNGPCTRCRFDMPAEGTCVDSTCTAACRAKYTGDSDDLEVENYYEELKRECQDLTTEIEWRKSLRFDRTNHDQERLDSNIQKVLAACKNEELIADLKSWHRHLNGEKKIAKDIRNNKTKLQILMRHGRKILASEKKILKEVSGEPPGRYYNDAIIAMKEPQKVVWLFDDLMMHFFNNFYWCSCKNSFKRPYLMQLYHIVHVWQTSVNNITNKK